MADTSLAERRSILELSPDERAEEGIDAAAVQEALIAVIRHGEGDQKVFEGRTFPRLELDYLDVGRENNHPVEFRDCTFEDGISVEHADVMVPLIFEDCEIAGLEIEDARFEYDVEVTGSRITGPVAAEESQFDRDCEFTDTVFEAETRLEELTCREDSSFDGAVFEGPVSFRGARFAGHSNAIDDNASFDGAAFRDEAVFEEVRLRASTFVGTTFEGAAEFGDLRVDGDVRFEEATFGAGATFAEARFTEDATFAGATFDGEADFRGAVFEGGARSLEDDASFEGATFDGLAQFGEAEFRYANFEDATFRDEAVFEEAWFTADADFAGATFDGQADFDEARFVEDADFSGATFRGKTVFRGAEFQGHANRLEDNATFDGATFEDDANFAGAEFTAANFMRVDFAGTIDFEDAAFTDRIDMMVLAIDEDPYVDLTDATIRGGTITQPKEGWVRYDLTRASVGDIDLQAADESGGSQRLLDYFRFCNTVFSEFDGNEFDFSAHTAYLDRNDWVLHEFDDPTDRSYAVELTPEVIETTYLHAKNSASAAGDMKAAGEFRVKRQQFARKKHLAIAGDGTADPGSRFKNGIRAAENAFLGITCGHGMRIFRIFAVFAVVPFVFGLLYAFGGEPFMTTIGEQPDSIAAAVTEPADRALFFEIVAFSYITFLTIGYGFTGPEGWAARILAPFEVYISVILGGLVLYALIKRSEM
ncbi:MAG: pentapeptide repeat-containing protein [Halorientalis sp.]